MGNVLSKIFSSGATDLIGAVGKIVDNVTTTKEEKMQLENELKKSEQQYQVEMKKLSVEEQRIIFQDVDSARKREATVQTSEHATRFSKNISPILAIFTTAITFTLFYLVIFKNSTFDPGIKDIVVYILGVLSTILTQVYSYYFGSSQGSSNKNSIIQGLKGTNQQ